MKTFKYLVNGLEVEAKYDEEDIDKVYKPLLNHWYDLYKQKQCRIVIFIAGCPGSGKSTFVSFLEYLFNQMDFDCKLQTVGMDGFHYYNEELDKMNLRKEKGSPRTFNVEKLKQKIIQTKKEDCYWPYYSRKLHDPIENQIFVHSEIIIIEGNYLLLKDEPWNQLERLCDESLFYNVNVEELHQYILDKASTNPLIEYNSSLDPDLLLEFDDYSKPQLRDVLFEQLHLSNEKYDEDVCDYLISCLDSNGYFKYSKDEVIKESLWGLDSLKYHLKLLRKLEPYGLFSFSLKECLSIQCLMSEKAESETGLILCDYLEELATQHYHAIIEKTELTQEEIDEGFDFIKTLNPKPAANYAQESTFLIPECKVSVEGENLQVELLKFDLSITVIDDDSLKKQRKEAETLLSALQKRNMTLLQIMNEMCHVQKDFFIHHGELKHLTLEMVAEKCGLAISTISRAITHKSFEFNNQYYSIKEMFIHSGTFIKNDKAIKKEITQIIEKENKLKPYSDEKIRKLLEEKDIYISRRTVTKYREECFIYNSRQRKIEKILWEEK